MSDLYDSPNEREPEEYICECEGEGDTVMYVCQHCKDAAARGDRIRAEEQALVCQEPDIEF